MDNALTVGMTPEEFWYADPEIYFNYVRVYEKKQKERQQEIWSIGVRFCQALQSTPVIPAGVVDRRVINSMPNYPECPFTEIDEQDYTEKDIEFQRQRALVHFTNWVNSFKRGG